MNDEEIIRLYFCRDEKALSESEKKYGGYCMTVAENVLGNFEDSSECFNSALFNAWNSIPPEKPKNLKIYLAKITRNLAINKLKAEKTQKRGNRAFLEVLDEISEAVPSKDNIEDNYIAKELEKSINEFIKKLPEKERNIFIRRYFFFESPEEIGDRYGFSSNRVSVIVHRTRKKLKIHLEKEGFLNG
ncbi:MAG: sigma-70 family RNA polymerase sigma factor [Oscillospiraceae bacterium]|nr:sigma-70 family RNA polymerase sigma factor [Oscillospiraceae bacterium]